MKINDEKLFRHYYDVRKEEHINIQQFIEDYFLQITPKTFLRKYREWLQMNNLEYIYWSVEEYINWYTKHFQISQIVKDRCYNYYNKLKSLSINFSNLTLATAIFFINSGVDQEEIKELAGISLNTINQCISFLSNLGINNNVEIGQQNILNKVIK